SVAVYTNSRDAQMTDDSLEPQVIERRAFVRFPVRLNALWIVLGNRQPQLDLATIHDVSIAGVGMELDREVPEGQLLVLRVPTMTLGWNSHLVRVCCSRQKTPGWYYAGCAFVKPLTMHQLNAIV